MDVLQEMGKSNDEEQIIQDNESNRQGDSETESNDQESEEDVDVVNVGMKLGAREEEEKTML